MLINVPICLRNLSQRSDSLAKGFGWVLGDCWLEWSGLGRSRLLRLWCSISVFTTGRKVVPGNPTLWRGLPVAPIQNSFGWSGRDWKLMKKLLIPCKFCTYWFISYPPYSLPQGSHRSAYAKYEKSWLLCLPGGQCFLVCCGSAMLTEHAE